MPITRRQFSSTLTGMLLGAALPSAVLAQTFPTRPVRLLVPYAAGGGTDAIARLVAQGVGEKLGQSLIVENNGAAGGNVASQQAASAAPDGYTILMANQGPMVVNPHLFKNMKVDPLTAFDPVTLITAAPLLVVVAQNSPHKDLKSLVEYGQKNPGKLTYGSAGNGSASHLATDLIGGRTDFMITTMPSVLGLIEGSQVRPIGVTSKERSRKFPDVPSVAESGFPGYEATAWYGFVVPKGTPKEINEAIRKATLETIKAGVVRERLEAEGAEPIGNTPEEFAAMMKAESARWAGIIKDAGIKTD
jgi:tripartite-type tricarboxylate transporter receptor subunit TctC